VRFGLRRSKIDIHKLVIFWAHCNFFTTILQKCVTIYSVGVKGFGIFGSREICVLLIAIGGTGAV